MKKLEHALNLPPNTTEKVRGMAKQCCMFSGGMCDVLECKCVVAQDSTILECSYFVHAVLPADNVLNNKILEFNGQNEAVKKFNKKCKECGRAFKSDSKSVQFCPKCAKKKESERKKAYKKRQSEK